MKMGQAGRLVTAPREKGSQKRIRDLAMRKKETKNWTIKNVSFMQLTLGAREGASEGRLEEMARIGVLLTSKRKNGGQIEKKNRRHLGTT